MSKPVQQQILSLSGYLSKNEKCWISTKDTELIESFAGPVSAGESLWIYGNKGVGKTALVTRLAAKNHWAYYDCDQIVPDDALNFFDALSEDRTLVLDRIDSWLLDIRVESSMFSWWKRREGGICLVSQKSPRARGMFLIADLQSRAISSLIFEVAGFTDEQCEQLLYCQLRERDLFLKDEVISFLKPRLPRNPGRLVELIQHIDKTSLREKRRVTIRWLSNLLNSNF